MNASNTHTHMRPRVEKTLNNKGILLIDRHDEWRKRSADGLRAAGAQVVERGDYEYPPPPEGALRGEWFDLVVLGCPCVGSEERKLISRVLEHGHPLQVLSTSLPGPMMRLVFLAGVIDITDKPYDPIRLVRVVSQALDAIEPRDSYQAVAQEALR